MEVLYSLSEEGLEELYKEVLQILDIYKDKYTEAFLLGDFIEINYDSLLKDRFKAIKKKYGELNYEVLNKDKIIRNLKAKIDDKASIRELLQNIYEKYNLTQYTVTLDFLPFVIHVKEKRLKKKYRENKLFRIFESIYDKLIKSLRPSVDPNIKQECFSFFLEIWYRIKKGTKLRAPEILSPITVFMFFYMKGIHLEIKNICRRLKMTDKEFRQILNETIKKYPEYLKRDREILVRNFPPEPWSIIKPCSSHDFKIFGISHFEEKNISRIRNYNLLIKCSEIFNNKDFTLIISRYFRMFDTNSIQDRILNAYILLESIFTSQSRGEVTFKLPLNVALFLSSNNTEFSDIYEFIKTFYDIRSKIAHGNEWLSILKNKKTNKISIKGSRSLSPL